MDLKLIDATDDATTFDFEVIDPKTQKTLMFLTLAGPTHEASVALDRKRERKLSSNIKRSRDAQKAINSQWTDALDDDDLALERQIEFLMARTIDWPGMESDGKPAAFDKTLMEKWYRSKRWLRDMVIAELGRAENFIGSSQSKSLPTASTSSN